MKIDKSLQEVWDWKEGVYQQIKHFSVEESANKIHKDAEQIKRQRGLKLKTFHLKTKD